MRTIQAKSSQTGHCGTQAPVKTATSNTAPLHHPTFGNLRTKYRKEKSFWGYDPSVLKSGIQKYARRAEVEKGLWCLIEMDLFSLLESNGQALRRPKMTEPTSTQPTEPTIDDLIDKLSDLKDRSSDVAQDERFTRNLEDQFGEILLSDQYKVANS